MTEQEKLGMEALEEISGGRMSWQDFRTWAEKNKGKAAGMATAIAAAIGVTVDVTVNGGKVTKAIGSAINPRQFFSSNPTKENRAQNGDGTEPVKVPLENPSSDDDTSTQG